MGVIVLTKKAFFREKNTFSENFSLGYLLLWPIYSFVGKFQSFLSFYKDCVLGHMKALIKLGFEMFWGKTDQWALLAPHPCVYRWFVELSSYLGYKTCPVVYLYNLKQLNSWQKTAELWDYFKKSWFFPHLPVNFTARPTRQINFLVFLNSTNTVNLLCFHLNTT